MYVRVGIQLSDRAFPWQVQNSLMRKTECWYEWYVFAVSILMVSILQRSWLELGERAYLVQGGPLCPLNFIRTTVWTLHSCFKETVLQLQGALHLSQATAPNPDVPHSQSFQTNWVSLGRPLQERRALKTLHDPAHFSSRSEWGTLPSNIAECDWFNSWPMIGLYVRLCDWWTWKLCCDWCKLQSYICMPQPPPDYTIWLFRLLFRSRNLLCCPSALEH